ncbi:short-chain dehydrogenase [Mycobacterium alsense]|uniref:SDR family NAD(P)-dependent oxidoreductase n=1 Tax=Mycobacterium alsense TaxID=324058 RepID=A0AA42BXT0_9MYCO|nr:SDR family NAD(P)-dependent oxidoreductase [Mycobacterium alsense]MCV7378551.1 SDR family NAD(P)-dependent oxidoreductase [Mycobacterium alsense]OQZ90851.1 short-chain dehydrogenase [Mycobacterium alsense]
MAATEARNTPWSEGDVGDQVGRVAVVTGANTGIGYHTAAVLAYRGAHVVLAVRNLDKGNAALSRIVAAGGHGARKVDVTLQALDLSSLDSVRYAADALRAAYPRIDLLINNAGVMWTPKQLTADGFEMQFGTNHLGHFALTGLLLDRMLGVGGSRVVTVSSLGHRLRAAIHFDDLQWERRYDRVGAYGQSKLANLLFTYELQRRLAARPEAKTIAVAAHPGGSNTELTRHLPAIVRPAAVVLGPVLFQTAAMGALPTLRAATDPTVEGGQYYGPRGFAEQRGHPKLVRSSAQSHDEKLQRRLWAVSEELTGVRFPV